MKKNYYEILGILEGADKKEIKRAYFKLVRMHSPEKDPEKFQEIREAYENLIVDRQAIGSDVFYIPSDPIATRMMDKIQEKMKSGHYSVVCDIAEEANSVFGETEGFLFYLALAQRLDGYTGKSVKNFEKLTALFPDKVRHQRELAISYTERGFENKAFIAFEKAYSMGCRDDEFISMFGLCANERGEWRRSKEILLEMVKKERGSLRDSMMELLDAFKALFLSEVSLKDDSISEVIAAFRHFIRSATAYVKEYEEEFVDAAGIMHMACAANLGEIPPEAIAVIEDLQSKIPGRSFENSLSLAEKEAESERMSKDRRISDTMANAYFSYQAVPLMCDGDTRLERYMKLDANLCILEEWPENQKEFLVLKKEYSGFYKMLQDMHEDLEKGKKDFLKSRYLKEYNRMYAYMEASNYYDQYPQMKKGMQEVKWDSSEEGSFARKGKKIGRNDPCPCGSGKKYKNCCGKA